MSKTSKTSAVFLTLIIVMSCLTLLIVRPASAQSTPKPSVPEFTLKYVDHSYDVPPTYGIDPYTGKKVVTKEGHHVENKSIEVTIKNQPLSPNNEANGFFTHLYYNFRYKGHYANDWIYSPEISYKSKLHLL